MAEYIDKQIILDKCQRLIDVERKQGSDVMNYGRERVNQTEVIMEYIEYMTPADVIELKPILEEYEELIQTNPTSQQIDEWCIRTMRKILADHYAEKVRKIYE